MNFAPAYIAGRFPESQRGFYRSGLNLQTNVTKKQRLTERPMTTALFLLRCVQIGLHISELDLLTIGMVNDLYAENGNDECQEDMDRF